MSFTHLDLHEVNWFQEAWLSSEHAGIEHSPSSGDDLAPTTMDGVSVESHVMDVEPYSPHILLAQWTLQGGWVWNVCGATQHVARHVQLYVATYLRPPPPPRNLLIDNLKYNHKVPVVNFSPTLPHLLHIGL